MAMSSCLVRYVLVFLMVVSIASAMPAQVVLDHDEDLKRILTFDDIPTSHGRGNLTHSSHLTFSSFHLIDTSVAASTGFISPEDSDCAASARNALVASRHHNWSVWPRIVLEPHTAPSANISPFFDLIGFNWKPMNYTPQFTRTFVNAYGILDGEIRTHYSLSSAFWREGHYPSYPLNITRFFPGWGRNVNMVEMYALAPNGTDWHFCVDNVMVEFRSADHKGEIPIYDFSSRQLKKKRSNVPRWCGTYADDVHVTGCVYL